MIIVHFIEYISKRVYEHAQKPTSTCIYKPNFKHKYSPLYRYIFKFSKHLEYIHIVHALRQAFSLLQKSRKKMREYKVDNTLIVD